MIGYFVKLTSLNVYCRGFKYITIIVYRVAVVKLYYTIRNNVYSTHQSDSNAMYTLDSPHICIYLRSIIIIVLSFAAISRLLIFEASVVLCNNVYL